ncbi:MAG: helix-turn-helix transcriptional regulator [Ardenticatenia bacterium]|nr:helix-turn-helix transcriptional regulator [Ardenticatenia bacterium]
MGKAERFRAEADGWSVGNADEFLGLSADESTYIEVKLALAGLLVERRKAASLTQSVLARQVKTSQSRLAKMEHADTTVSVDLLVRTLLSTGASWQDIARVIAA